MNIAVDCLPVFRACPNTGQAGPEHYGTIHLGTERWAWRKDLSISLCNVVSALHSSVGYFVAAGVCKFFSFMVARLVHSRTTCVGRGMLVVRWD